MNRNRLLVCASLLLASAASASGQEQKPTSLRDRITIETSFGYQHVPGFILGRDNLITKHPDNLKGWSGDARFSLNLGKRWSLGLQVSGTLASGHGQWSRKSAEERLARNGIRGSTFGKTDWAMRSIAFDVGQSFLRGKTHPYWRAGFGVGKLDVKFKGNFHGCAISDVGCSRPIDKPASDRTTRIIPVPVAEGGLQIDLAKHLGLVIAGSWNTGFSLKCRLKFNFKAHP